MVRELLQLLRAHDQTGGDLQIAQVTGDAHVADHRPADEGDLAAVLVGGVQDLLDAVHVAGEAGDDDPAWRGAHHLLDRRVQLPLGGGEAGYFGVGGVGEEQVHALLAEAGEGAQIGDAVIEGKLVHLEVAGVQHHPGPGADGDREAVRDGVVDRHELAVEGPEATPVALPHPHRARPDAVFLELGLQESQRQLGADDGNVGPLAQQVRHAADVVLVAVGEYHGHDVVQPVPDRGEVRQDHIHPGLGLLGEQHAAVDDEQLARVLEDGHVAADLTQAAQGDDPQPSFRQGRGGFQLGVRMTHTLTVPGERDR